MAQAHTLDSIFTTLVRRASTSEHLTQTEAFLRLGLKAQAQSRATVEALAAMKNPAPVAYIRQANVGQNVQVNNGTVPSTSSAREIEIPPNRLSGSSNELLPDTGASALTSRTDSQMEAVGSVDGTEDPRGKGEGKPKRLEGRP